MIILNLKKYFFNDLCNQCLLLKKMFNLKFILKNAILTYFTNIRMDTHDLSFNNTKLNVLESITTKP